MPTINLGKSKPREVTAKKQQYQHIYQDRRWKRMRAAKIANNPLCEKCEVEGRVTPTTEVHHKIPFQTGRNTEEVERLAFEWDNLMSVCTSCHKELDNKIRRGERSFFLFLLCMFSGLSCLPAHPLSFLKFN